MYFKNLVVFDVPLLTLTEDKIGELLQEYRYIPCDGNDESSSGFASPHPELDDPLFFAQEGTYLFAYKTESKKVANDDIEEELKNRLLKLKEADPDGDIDAGEKDTMRDKIKYELLPKARSTFSTVFSFYDPKSRRLYVESISIDKASTMVKALVSAIESEQSWTFTPILPIEDASKCIKDWIKDPEKRPEALTFGDKFTLVNHKSNGKIKYDKFDETDKQVITYVKKQHDVVEVTLEQEVGMSGLLNVAGFHFKSLKYDASIKAKVAEAASDSETAEEAIALKFDLEYKVGREAIVEFIDVMLGYFGGGHNPEDLSNGSADADFDLPDDAGN
ncbi:recombination-associated protein RdgC [Vibrio splendidus]